MTDYSRGDYADLPAGTTDLENNYSAPDLTAIASNDNSTYAEQTANNEIAIHQYKKTVTGQYTNITWSGKSSLAPSESPVIMEVYNVTGTPAWEELDRDDSTAADTDFDIIYNNLATADYLDSGVITWRVYQAASAGTPYTETFGDRTGADHAGCEDTLLNGLSGGEGLNYGNSAVIYLHYLSNDGLYLVSLFRFTGISSIPSNATITSVSLSFYGGTSGGDPHSFKIYKLLRNWIVGTLDGAAGYSNYDYWASGNAWTTPGALGSGDRAATESATFTDSGSDTQNKFFTVPSTAELVADVQSWVDGSATNNGWGLFQTSDNGSNQEIYASDHATAANRPLLTVEYTA